MVARLRAPRPRPQRLRNCRRVWKKSSSLGVCSARYLGSGFIELSLISTFGLDATAAEKVTDRFAICDLRFAIFKSERPHVGYLRGNFRRGSALSRKAVRHESSAQALTCKSQIANRKSQIV